MVKLDMNKPEAHLHEPYSIVMAMITLHHVPEEPVILVGASIGKYMSQSCVEIEDYSITHFDYIAVFEMSYR